MDGAKCLNDASCDDGNVCNGPETCNVAGACEGGTALQCDPDSVLCTKEKCHPTDGCVHVKDHKFCSDFLDCTVDTCDIVKGCEHNPDSTKCNDDVGGSDGRVVLFGLTQRSVPRRFGEVNVGEPVGGVAIDGQRALIAGTTQAFLVVRFEADYVAPELLRNVEPIAALGPPGPALAPVASVRIASVTGTATSALTGHPHSGPGLAVSGGTSVNVVVIAENVRLGTVISVVLSTPDGRRDVTPGPPCSGTTSACTSSISVALAATGGKAALEAVIPSFALP